jgi:hypothetical protein|tara:strand:+ start:941 stop:1360 length:420 start_codon:yes stop_codon:yes gene_type:complete
MKRSGRKSKAQTPAPRKDRIKGSKTNVKGSAKSRTSARSIKFSDSTLNSIKSKLKEYNAKNPNKKISLPTAKAVVRRGMGAYSTSYRPTIRGGKPNSRNAWGLSRLYAFMRKKSRSESAKGVVPKRAIKKSYVQDNDLL